MDATSLAMLMQLALAARDAAAARRAQAQRALGAAHTQLELLHGYTRDYAQRASRQLAQGVDAAAQGNTRAFGGRLDAAVAAQLAELARREALLRSAEHELADLQRRVASLQALTDRRAAAQRSRESRREQKTNDELARAASARRATSDSDW